MVSLPQMADEATLRWIYTLTMIGLWPCIGLTECLPTGRSHQDGGGGCEARFSDTVDQCNQGFGPANKTLAQVTSSGQSLLREQVYRLYFCREYEELLQCFHTILSACTTDKTTANVQSTLGQPWALALNRLCDINTPPRVTQSTIMGRQLKTTTSLPADRVTFPFGSKIGNEEKFFDNVIIEHESITKSRQTSTEDTMDQKTAGEEPKVLDNRNKNSRLKNALKSKYEQEKLRNTLVKPDFQESTSPSHIIPTVSTFTGNSYSHEVLDTDKEQTQASSEKNKEAAKKVVSFLNGGPIMQLQESLLLNKERVKGNLSGSTNKTSTENYSEDTIKSEIKKQLEESKNSLWKNSDVANSESDKISRQGLLDRVSIDQTVTKSEISKQLKKPIIFSRLKVKFEQTIKSASEDVIKYSSYSINRVLKDHQSNIRIRGKISDHTVHEFEIQENTDEDNKSENISSWRSFLTKLLLG